MLGSSARRIAQSQPVAAIVAGPELSPGPSVMNDDRAALAGWVRNTVSTYHHPVGTCAMGPDPDNGAVTDARGSVHGFDGLTIADASIMPIIPTATTNLPTIVLAEHEAQWLTSRVTAASRHVRWRRFLTRPIATCATPWGPDASSRR
jgi:choline dehydrogenase